MSDWNNMVQWELVLPPSRPSLTDLQLISDKISFYDREMPVAVLGSTIEFRELLFKLGFKKIYIFEKNLEFYSLITKLMYFTPEEILIEGDWLNTVCNYQNYFQFVLSDLTMGNIKYNNRNKFYNDIYNAIKDNGLFIDKVLTIDFELLKLNILFEKYENLPINLRSINDFSSEVLFCSELLQEKKSVDSSKFYDLLKNGNFSPKIKMYAEKAQMITPRGFEWDYGIPWIELSGDYLAKYKTSNFVEDKDISSPYFEKVKQFFNYK